MQKKWPKPNQRNGMNKNNFCNRGNAIIMEMLLRFCVKLGHCKMKPLNILTSSKAEAPPLTDATGGHSLLCSSAPQTSWWTLSALLLCSST